MGACQNCHQKAEEVTTEVTTATYDEVKKNVSEMDKATEAQAEDVAAKVVEAQEAVESKEGELTDAVERDGDEAKEAMVMAVEETAAVENAANGPTVEVVENKEAADAKTDECKEAVEAKPEEGKEPAEKVEASEQKAQSLVLQFGKKEQGKKDQGRKTVEFFYQPLGLEFDMQVKKTGCACMRTSKGPVKVTNVEEGQQGQTLGVETGAFIYINGKVIVDVKQLQDLISKLPNKAAPAVTL